MSKKLLEAILRPRHAGILTQELASSKEMRYVEVSVGSLREGLAFALYLIVDESDGVIADAKFQVFGPSTFIGILEGVCCYLIRKHCSALGQITAEIIERQLRDHPEVCVLPREADSYLNLAVDALDDLGSKTQDLSHPEKTSRPTPVMAAQESQLYPGWELLSKEEKIAVIEQVVAVDIRPYIELDEGGIEVVDLIDGKELIITYQGACTTCYSSTGATLNAIQGILRAKVSPDITVTPDSSLFS